MIGTIAVSVNHSDLCFFRERVAQVAEQDDGFRYLVIGLKKQDGIHGSGQKGIIRLAQDRFHIVQICFLQATVNVQNRLWVDVHRVNNSFVAHSSRCQYSEKSRARPDIRHTLAEGNSKGVHHAIDSQSLSSAGLVEDRFIASVRSAGRTVCWRRSLGKGGYAKNGEKDQEP
jgi:hypothetical protein